MLRNIFRTKLVIFFVYSYLCTEKNNAMRYFITLIATLLTIAAYGSAPLREVYSLNDNWQFFYSNDHDSDAANIVNLPHTWNNDTAIDKIEYKRTTAKYIREVYIPAEWSTRRLFMRFGGVQSVANVFVNGRHVGEHRGGYTAFTFEITQHITFGSNNHIMVIASNAERNDILPISTNLDLYGGIYRDVELLTTGKHIISPLHYSSDGIFVEQHKVNENEASGVVRVYLSTPGLDHIAVNMRIVAPDGYEVDSHTVKASKGDTERGVEIAYSIKSPELWSPDSPALYTVEVSLGNEEAPSDFLAIQTGFRSITTNSDNRLCINGVPATVRGVNLGHDRSLYGTAICREHILSDLDMIEDMGATALRSLNGPHIDELYAECDRRGMLVWVDIPFTRHGLALADICYYPTDAFHENGRRQLREIIAQNFNHPSVVMWGIYSLVWQRGDDVVPYIKELNDLAHTLDNTRKTVGCSNQDGAINFATDLVALRQSVGWYRGNFDDVSVWCHQLSSNKAWENLRYAVSYGEEGASSQQCDIVERAERNTRHLPERRQRIMHERYASIVSDADIFWGVWIDNMFDYSSARRPYAMNYSGVVDYDHRSTKDAFWLYRTMWNRRSATLHIAERRWRERRDTLQQLTVYCSTGRPTLMVGSDTVEVRSEGYGRWVADSVVMHGEVMVRATDATGRLRDSVSLRVGNVLTRREPQGLRTL